MSHCGVFLFSPTPAAGLDELMRPWVLGYIDLSKRRVSAEDVVKCEERFNKSKMVHSILRHVAEKTKEPIEHLYEKIGWPLMKKYGHAVDAFKFSITFVAVLPSDRHIPLTPRTATPTSGKALNSLLML